MTLRTLLREFEFGTTYAPDEPAHSRGVATAPGRGGLAVVYRRSPRSLAAFPTPRFATSRRMVQQVTPELSHPRQRKLPTYATIGL